MPRDSSGNYTLPPGNPVVGGTLITAGWANPTMTDIGAELTNSLDRSGRGGMLAPFKFADGTVGAPGITWNAEPTSGIFRAGGNDMQAVIAGVPRMRWTASSVDVWDTGSSTWLPIVGPSGSTYALVGSPNTFTAVNTFTQPVLFTYPNMTGGSLAAIVIQSVQPNLIFRDTDAALDEKVWRLVGSNTIWALQLADDLGVGTVDAIRLTRAAAALTNIQFGNATNNPSFTFLGSGSLTFGGTLSISNTAPELRYNESDQAADEKVWRARVQSKSYLLETQNDAISAGRSMLSFARGTGIAVTSMSFGNATDNPTYNFLGTGNTIINGAITATSQIAIDNAQPNFIFLENDQAVDEKRWRFRVNGKSWFLETVDDAVTASRQAFGVARGVGMAITTIAFGNATDNPTFTFSGTGTVTAGGNIASSGVGQHVVTVSTTTSGDALLTLDAIGVQNWTVGNQRSTGNFIVSSANIALSSPRLTITPTGAATFSGSVTVNGAFNLFNSVAALITATSNPVIYSTSGSGTGDFAEAGNLIFQPRSNSANLRDMVFFTGGDTPVERMRILRTGETRYTGQQQSADGALGTPSYSFASEAGLGMFRNGAGVISFGVGASLLSSMSSAGLVLKNSVRLFTPDGTNAAPAVTFESDSNTGLYLISPDALGFAEGGAGFRIGYRNIPRSTTATTAAIGDVGKCIAITATIAIPVSVFAAGDAFSIYNDSAGALTVTMTAGNLRLAGTTVTASPRTIAPRGMMTLWFNVGGATPDVVCSGPGVS